MEAILEFFGMGPPPKLADLIKAKRAELEDARLDLDYECRQMDRDETKLTKKIKERAGKGQMREVRALARRIVQFQRSRESMINVQSRLQEVETTLATVQTQKQLTEALAMGVRALRAIRLGSVGHASLFKVLQAFSQEQTKAESMTEMLDSETGLDDDAEEEDDLVQEVLAGLNIEMADDLDGLSVVVGQGGAGNLTSADRAREQRLARLARPSDQ